MKIKKEQETTFIMFLMKISLPYSLTTVKSEAVANSQAIRWRESRDFKIGKKFVSFAGLGSGTAH